MRVVSSKIAIVGLMNLKLRNFTLSDRFINEKLV